MAVDLDKEEDVANKEDVTNKEDSVNWAEKAAQLQKDLDSATAEAAKQRNLKKDAVGKSAAEREQLEFVKKQNEEILGKMSKYAEKAKSAAVTLAATKKLTAMGINPDFIALAIKEIDPALITYDEDMDKVDDTGLSTGLSKIKTQYPVMFERSVRTPKYIPPADGAANADSKVLSREDFNSMTPAQQREQIMAGKTIE